MPLTVLRAGTMISETFKIKYDINSLIPTDEISRLLSTILKFTRIIFFNFHHCKN